MRADSDLPADQLAYLQDRLVLSINDTPGAREVIGKFRFDEVETTWTPATATVGAGQRVHQLISTERR